MRGRAFLGEEYFPGERRAQFVYRGKKVLEQVIIECQKHLVDSVVDGVRQGVRAAREDCRGPREGVDGGA